jgi:hypothetical protein
MIRTIPWTGCRAGDILPGVNAGASRTALGYLPVYDMASSLVLNIPLSRSNR